MDNNDEDAPYNQSPPQASVWTWVVCVGVVIFANNIIILGMSITQILATACILSALLGVYYGAEPDVGWMTIAGVVLVLGLFDMWRVM